MFDGTDYQDAIINAGNQHMTQLDSFHGTSITVVRPRGQDEERDWRGELIMTPSKTSSSGDGTSKAIAL
jgi:hypothetical protein